MNHARAVVADRFPGARGRCGRSIQGSSKQLGVLRRQDVTGLCFQHTLCFALDRRTQKYRFVYA